MKAAEPSPSDPSGTGCTCTAPTPGPSTTSGALGSSSALRTAAASAAATIVAPPSAAGAGIGGRARTAAAALTGSGRYGARAVASTAARTPACALSCSMRRSTHAPRSSCMFASCTSWYALATAGSRYVPRTKSLNEPMAGPHQTWKSIARSVTPAFAQPLERPRYQRKMSAILPFGSASARLIFSGSLSWLSVKSTVSCHTVSIGLRKTVFSSRCRTSAGMASSDGYARKSSYSLSARDGNMVPFLSTCSLTPDSNMSAAGAITTSLYVALESCSRTVSHVPDCRASWLIVPVTTKSAPIAKAAAAASGQPMPPPAPTRTCTPVSSLTASRRAMMTGRSTCSGRLSVWPPLSASTVTSSHIGTVAASAACSAVTLPSLSSRATMSAGGGRSAMSASSVRDTLKMIEFLQTVLPVAASRERPTTR
mmetsp:Transcript_18878/g.62294  ORF Transcript_18878/g.62294 Transcript_18878/m.62294 type:complete len:425 (+) Transcript_18878:1379-2653(+)